jgi:hypothetical protein
MRRATAAALGTLIGTTLLVAAKYGAPSATAGTATAISAGDPAAAAGGVAAGSAPPDALSSSAAAAVPGPSGTPAAPGAAPSGAARTTAPPQPARTTPAGGGGATTAPPPPPSCSTVSGNGQNVASPGIGTVTVTIKVCNGAISSASSTQSQSNWSNNTAALPALNSLTPQYYKTNISAIHYSGATLTSAAYQTSLRSAMSKAGI